jgi:hypothetical protein
VGEIGHNTAVDGGRSAVHLEVLPEVNIPAPGLSVADRLTE